LFISQVHGSHSIREYDRFLPFLRYLLIRYHEHVFSPSGNLMVQIYPKLGRLSSLRAYPRKYTSSNCCRYKSPVA
jgi:hypothetical protein